LRSFLAALLKTVARFFLVPFRGRTWLNLLHLLLGVPLSLVYFVILVAGLSIGLATLPIVWGVLVLAGLLLVLKGLAAFERGSAILLLGARVPPMALEAPPSRTDWEMIKRHLKNPVTWKSPLYLLLKFPLGLAALVLGTTGFSLAVALVALAFGIEISDLSFYFGDLEISTGPFSVAFAGLLAGLLTFHLLNGLAALNGWLAIRLLGRRAPAAEAAAQSLVTA
jgi:hypothetical protein